MWTQEKKKVQKEFVCANVSIDNGIDGDDVGSVAATAADNSYCIDIFLLHSTQNQRNVYNVYIKYEKKDRQNNKYWNWLKGRMLHCYTG